MNKTCVRSKDNMNSVGDMPMLCGIPLVSTDRLDRTLQMNNEYRNITTEEVFDILKRNIDFVALGIVKLTRATNI